MTDKADLNKLLDDWRDPYGARTVTLASDLIDALLRERHNFVEQACEAVDEVITNSKAPGFNNGYDHCKVKVKQAIKDKFK